MPTKVLYGFCMLWDFLIVPEFGIKGSFFFSLKQLITHVLGTGNILVTCRRRRSLPPMLSTQSRKRLRSSQGCVLWFLMSLWMATSQMAFLTWSRQLRKMLMWKMWGHLHRSQRRKLWRKLRRKLQRKRRRKPGQKLQRKRRRKPWRKLQRKQRRKLRRKRRQKLRWQRRKSKRKLLCKLVGCFFGWAFKVFHPKHVGKLGWWL